MAVHTHPKAQGFVRPQQQNLNGTRVPAPNRGVDNRMPYGEMGFNNSIYSYNIIPSENGMLVRKGYSEHCTDVTNGGNLGIKTLMKFNSASDPSSDRIFAVNNEGIWNVTSYDTAPTLMFTFVTDVTAESGHGNYIQYKDAAGAEYLFYADSRNGLFTYAESSDTWVQTTGITGVSAADIDFVTVHKQRIWLVERDSDVGWYLPVAAIAGSATAFYFGDKFKKGGGKLSTLINWSVDGGAGLDDYLIAVSSGGDVLPYQGTDPSGSDWNLKGSYYIGQTPKGKQYFDEYEGEVYILSAFGLVSATQLLRGTDVSGQNPDGLSYPIADTIRQYIKQTIDEYGWQVKFVAGEGILVISSPRSTTNLQYIQYVMNISVRGWGFWRTVPIACMEEVGSLTWFGTEDGRVIRMNTTRDNVLLDSADPNYLGVRIPFSLLTGHSDMGSPAKFKRGAFARPDFLAQTAPNFQTRIYYDYYTGERGFSIPPYFQDSLYGLWDSAIWDASLWGPDYPENISQLQGQTGIGRVLAIALRGEAVDETRLVSFDVMWDVGGMI